MFISIFIILPYGTWFRPYFQLKADHPHPRHGNLLHSPHRPPGKANDTPPPPLPGFYLQPRLLPCSSAAPFTPETLLTFSSLGTLQIQLFHVGAAVDNPFGDPTPAVTPPQGCKPSANRVRVSLMTWSLSLSFAFHRHENLGQAKLSYSRGHTRESKG